MSVLTQTAQDAAAAASQQRFSQLQTLLQNQYGQKVAALQSQSSLPSGQENFLTVQISHLSQQKSIFNTAETQLGNNLITLGDLSSKLTALQNAAQAGDSAAFDDALNAVTTDVGNLGLVKYNPALQDDGVTALKINGFSIQSSSAYDLSTAAGQAAALADINTAQQTTSQIVSLTTINQAIAGAQVTSLGSQYDSANNTLHDDQTAAQLAATQQILTLKNQLNTNLHLAELQFTNSQAAAKSLENQQNNLQAVLSAPPPGTILSIFS
ncbi:MAG TPA: hypothetical protein VMU85_22985 [Stellaceae bacterium]|nr:hypothetical protein [Stellaceae bacterium]